MRKLVISLVLGVTTLGLLGLTRPMTCSPPFGPTSCAQAQPVYTRTVRLYDNYFSPSELHVAPGTAVQWVNEGHHQHTVTAAKGDWDSGAMDHGATFGQTFTARGTYPYYCRFHGKMMRGTVVVD